MKTARRIQQVEEYYFSKKLAEIREMSAGGERVINLGIGSPDLPPHPDVIRVLSEASVKFDSHQYQPYRGLPQFKEAIAGFHQRHFDTLLDSKSELLPLMGSKEGITHISMAFLDPASQVLIPELGYPTYTSVTKMVEAEPIYYPLDESGVPDWEFLESLDYQRIRLLWLNYPHMPTGARGSIEIFEKFVDLATRNNFLIAHDNPYCLILNDQPLSIFQVNGSKEVALELHSLSKSFNMAGWRIGWVVGAAELIDSVVKIKSNMDSGMFKPIQMAGAKALELGRDWFDQINEVYSSRKKLALDLLDKIGCEVHEDQVGMFVWAKCPGLADELVDNLLYNHRVFITPGHIFGDGGNSFVRISLCSPEEDFRSAMERVS